MRSVSIKRPPWLAAHILIAACSGPALIAQSRPARSPTAVCVQGDRIRRCRSFAIIELPIAARLVRTLRSQSGGVGDAYFGLELGGMVNRDDSHAIGASIAGAASAGESYFAINARSRAWFSGKSYRDLSAGLVAMGSSGHSTAYGLTASAGSGYSDLVGLWAGADLGLIGGPPRVSVHAGVRLGSYATLSVIGLAAAALGLGGGIHDGT